MWIDSHCHLDYDYSPFSVDEIIERARTAKLQGLVTIGVTLESSRKLSQFSEHFEEVVHTVGIHPQDVQGMDRESAVAELKQLQAHPKCRAIGEIGLDYFRADLEQQSIQRLCLEVQLELAAEVQKPVVIHSRDAEPDLLPRLQHYAQKARLRAGQPVGVIHCFTGTLEFAKACLDLGFLISISGILTFKNATTLREVVSALPLDRLMVETDAPYLAPVPHRGKKAEPSMVVHTGHALADLFSISVEQVAERTTQNARSLFWPGDAGSLPER